MFNRTMNYLIHAGTISFSVEIFSSPAAVFLPGNKSYSDTFDFNWWNIWSGLVQLSVFVTLPTWLSVNLHAICLLVSPPVFVCLCVVRQLSGGLKFPGAVCLDEPGLLIMELWVTLFPTTPSSSSSLLTVHILSLCLTHVLYPPSFPHKHSQRLVVNEGVVFLLWKWHVSKIHRRHFTLQRLTERSLCYCGVWYPTRHCSDKIKAVYVFIYKNQRQ